MSIDADTPEQVVASVLGAFKERRWHDAGALFDAAILDGAYEHALSAMRSYAEGPQSLEDFRHKRRELPEAVAEHMWNRYKQHLEERGSPLGHQFPGVRSVEELEQLSRVDLMARWLQDEDPREMMRRQSLRAGAEPPPGEMLGVPLNPLILGTITETENLAHVVYRALHDSGEDPDNAGLAKATSLRRTQEGWRLVDRHLFSYGGWFAY